MTAQAYFGLRAFDKNFNSCGLEWDQDAVIDPPSISCGAITFHKHVLGPPVRCNLSVIQDQCDIARLLSGRIPSRSIIIPRSHKSVVVHPRQRCLPLDISSGQDASVEVAVHEDGPHRVVPGPAQGAGALDLGLGGPIVGEDLGRVDIHAVFVGERGVGTLPGCDATAAMAEGEGRVGDVECSEPIEEVRLAGYNDIVEVCVS